MTKMETTVSAETLILGAEFSIKPAPTRVAKNGGGTATSRDNMTFAVPTKCNQGSSTALMVIRTGKNKPRRMVLVLDEFNPNAFGFKPPVSSWSVDRQDRIDFKKYKTEWFERNQRPIFTSFVDAAHSCVVRQQNESGDFVPVSGIVYGSEKEEILIPGHEAAERAKKTFGRVDDDLREVIIEIKTQAKKDARLINKLSRIFRKPEVPALISGSNETLLLASPKP